MIAVIIPVGPNANAAQVARAIGSVERNDCLPVLQYDPDGKGAGWARNTALARVETEYVIALDCDDCLLDGAAEALLPHAEPNRVVYGDILVGSVRRRQNGVTVDKLLNGFDVPAVTALYPVALLRALGGWNESMAGLEDVELWIRLLKVGAQPHHVPAIVFAYEHNPRGRHTSNTGELWQALRRMYQDDWERAERMCCGKRTPRPAAETRLVIENPVYVLYTGRRTTAFGYPGPATRMPYHVEPGVVTRIDEKDVPGFMASGLFRIVTEEEMNILPGDPTARLKAWQGIQEALDGAQ